MKESETATGRPFRYKVLAEGEIIVYPAHEGGHQDKYAIAITPFTVDLAKRAIRAAGRIRMGASRDKPPAGSLGAMLKAEGLSPQSLCYLIPVLAAEDFCRRVTEGRAVIVVYRGETR